ncbi:hypothetical protein E2C01_049798 [Portunus trituberculatus]|uniref:Uncharacterized protein n=1 Tax=Portunus trituberculatus TaxID=210409 RepID=A0A5B7GH27_PORTR|nr:hypothetical protein [Portunus trituberculatus]
MVLKRLNSYFVFFLKFNCKPLKYWNTFLP